MLVNQLNNTLFYEINCDDYFDDEMKLQEYSDEISELEAELAATRDQVPNINMPPSRSDVSQSVSESMVGEDSK